ncbi:uncharacterized protein L969DRAFT_19939 [Mixia osmundae IAM 14324]|uniref:RRM domain-containing protein n=1 Tax=Mixia osmundae (strain CBS 9802 / IAM 14324 / JCM 22182 / KY 12970) TaxID=764103 RepID=G7E2L1_MIXOS|nr:uncharacterized protein L969DRAFT_19939 [Mixia osmundae IAM 14324]KEI36939.1 hypothetical protein L969DRAFT_19939 [Mixia osmundae IAM 14324]GAA97071.1 hypothetical protein E5Q_03746 [Mixia osmundae IAM 14324]
MSKSTVHVTNIHPHVDEEALKQFFSFSGVIDSIKYSRGNGHTPGTAEIAYQKENAARGAVAFTGASLAGQSINVSAADGSDDISSAPVLAQEDKPHAARAAELLSHGYILGDQAIQRSIDLDKTYGIADKFTSLFTSLKTRAQAIDEQRGISTKVQSSVTDIQERHPELQKQASTAYEQSLKYYTAALNSSVGHRVQEFYTVQAKTVADVHEEAKRIAEAKKGAPLTPLPTFGLSSATSSSTAAPAASASEAAPAAPAA